MIQKEVYRKYIFLGVILGLLYLSYLIIRPFLNPLLFAAIFAFLFYPVYRAILKIVKKDYIASFLVVLLAICLILIPVAFSSILFDQATDLYQAVKQVDITIVSSWVSGIVGNDINVANYIKNLSDKVFVYIIDKMYGFAFTIPQKIVSFFVFIGLFYYFLKEGKKIVRYIRRMLPLEERDKDKVIRDICDVSSAVVYGFFLSGIIAGLVGGFGFYMFGLGSPVFWGIVMMILTILPMVGTSLVWVPAVLIQFYHQEWSIGAGLLFYCLVLLGSIENFLRPKLIGSKAELHPGIVLIGVIGGLYSLGVVGVIIGPIVLGSLITFLNIQKR